MASRALAFALLPLAAQALDQSIATNATSPQCQLCLGKAEAEINEPRAARRDGPRRGAAATRLLGVVVAAASPRPRLARSPPPRRRVDVGI